LKSCSRCKKEKPLSDFYTCKDGRVLSHCKECGRARALRWYSENTEKAHLAMAAWVAKNPEGRKRIANKSAKKRRDADLEAARAYGRLQAKKHKLNRWAYRAKQRQENPEYNLINNLRCRIYVALKGANKSDTTKSLLGCSVAELKLHLSAQFKPGMTWENYGPVWHVDHIKPCAKFDLSRSDEQKKCFHFSNLQPLFAVENIRKGAAYLHS